MNQLPLAVVTGASSGIGRCIALLLGRGGYRTVLIARRVGLLETLAAEIGEIGATPRSRVLPMDLADVDAIEPVMSDLFAREGPASMVVNCAGFGVYAPFAEQTQDVLDRLMKVNHEAPVRMIRAALPGLLEVARAGGVAHVMNICSASARVGPWGHAGYGAAKGAMRSMTEVLAAEHGRDGVRFTLVYPGIVDTPYFRLPAMSKLWPRMKHRAISPERVAGAVVSGIGRSGVAMYVPGHYRLLDLMYAVSPALALRVVRGQSEG